MVKSIKTSTRISTYLAIFSEDGESYKAKIVLLKHWRSAAVVHFVDYGNQEEVKFEDLSPYKRPKVWHIKDQMRDYITYVPEEERLRVPEASHQEQEEEEGEEQRGGWR